MRVLVTGGAGYIGSAVTAILTRHGYDPVRFDVAPDPAPELGPFVTADVCDVDAVVRAMRDHAIAAVVHLAGYIAVGESVAEPLRYWDNNVRGALSLLEAMRMTGVRRIVFSSSAAVYGDPVEIPIPETHPIAPASPYGRTKWVV
ncbi:MAG: NAD-dependent epimerase/dehydratase family protein, partial [Clostridia bacterium]